MTTSPLLQLPNVYRAFYGTFDLLRPFQYEVIEPILQGRDLILQAATGSGKTEAVLAPCLERVVASDRQEAVLYVVPTRALVHDLRRRLQGLLYERLGLHLGLRTGDVKRLPAAQADVLLTTPESLDVMLGSRNRDVRAFLQRVTMLVVDEVHQLAQGYRGCHLAYLLHRLEARGGRRVQKMALSATLSGPEAVCKSLGWQDDTVWISHRVQRQIQPHLVHLKREPIELVAFINDLAHRFGARKLLLFANSRSRCDQLFGWLHQQGVFQQSTYLHYSNLKLAQRQEVERQFQRRGRALCIATSTLELGIDVGDVDNVILYEPPESVTTFLQRLGRASRQAQTTSFWGICRGTAAGAQLLQFLALCQLAQQGEVEAVQPATLPSVLAQQILSSLYEHQRVSLPSLQALFPPQTETLTALTAAMERRQWLCRLESHEPSTAWRGGWRYAHALRAHQIWSNFPNTEEPYTLEVDRQAVADLPPSIVRQLDLGDQVELAGRRIQILDIQDGDRKVVRAMPVETPEAKALSWIGTGPPVSWEVAQTVRTLLQPGYEPDDLLAQGLFARTRTLLQQQRQMAARRVVLHNGIELSRTPPGAYRYATYLGSIGNFMLQKTIEDFYGRRIEDFSCQSDAIAVTCSDRIDLQPLPLPLTRETLRHWTGQHLQAVQALFAFNAFARALSRELLLEEATALLWDARVLQAFAGYRQQSSAIASGDPACLEWHELPEAVAPPAGPKLMRQGPQPTLLAREKIRLGLAAEAAPLLPAVPATHQQPRALTGTMIGNYVQHQQCDRLLSFDLLPYGLQPPKRALVDNALGAVRAEQGNTFETRVVEWLAHSGAKLYRLAETASDGRRLSLQARQDRSMTCLAALIQQGVMHKACRPDELAPPLTTAPGQLLGILVQPVLMLPALTGTEMPVDGVGIPDLIEVTADETTVWLTIADIKDSVTPRYSQKWQVAFYAALLQVCLSQHPFDLPVRVMNHGVLFTRSAAPDAAPSRNVFDLTPYLEAWPLLLRHVDEVLRTPLGEAAWQLQAHCASCAYLDTCYRQSLSTDDAMLLPHLTPGTYLKLRAAGRHTLSQAADWTPGGDNDVPVDTEQAAGLHGKIRALVDNQVACVTETTSLFPANLSTVIFVHLLRHPVSGQPRAWGLQRLAPHAAAVPQLWIAAAAEDGPACLEAFCAQLRAWWQEGMLGDSGPHIVTFGMGSWRLLQASMPHAADPTTLDFLWRGDAAHHTDLRQVLRQHFALPIPLRLTLSALAQVWALTPELTPPPSVLQDEAEAVAEWLLPEPLNAEQMAPLQQYLQTCLSLQQQLWQICCAHLRSDWQQQSWEMRATGARRDVEGDCIDFLERQQRWRERDVLALQQLPLAQRLERYRALGPLVFETTTLDAEGRFLAHFRLSPESLPSRFRPGDFLRLNPLGSPDLQAGASVILAQYEPHAQRLAVMLRQGQPHLSPRWRYVLDEDLEDWTTPRVIHAVREGLAPGKHPHLTALLDGTLPLQQTTARLTWAQRWLQQRPLNTRQREALLLPFRGRLGLIEGPPGTGKTHLLAWMLIALICEAAQAGRPLRLVVSALTHQAIDNVLVKVQQRLQDAEWQHFPGRCLKWGQRLALADDDTGAPTLTYATQAEDILETPYLILGATGFGLYQLFESRTGVFPAFFDWVIFDEASQMVLPQALLSLVYGKGQYIFCGDIQQLPPVIRGPQAVDGESVPDQSILAHLLGVYDTTVHVRLNETYRLNHELCQLPSRLWYQGDLHPARVNARARLTVPPIPHPDGIDAILDPERPVTLVLADHSTDHQQSDAEVAIITALAVRLLLGYGLKAESLAILAPHRAQNNAMGQRLAHVLGQHCKGETITLPLIDTVERLQGAERDVVLFSLTTSDADHLESPFLNNPNRFNVAITRARHKLIVVGSKAFFTRVSRTENSLLAHQGFAAYYHQCRQHQALFEWRPPVTDDVVHPG